MNVFDSTSADSVTNYFRSEPVSYCYATSWRDLFGIFIQNTGLAHFAVNCREKASLKGASLSRPDLEKETQGNLREGSLPKFQQLEQKRLRQP